MSTINITIARDVSTSSIHTWLIYLPQKRFALTRVRISRVREAPGKREAPPSSLKFETIEVNCTRYRILVFSTVALIRKEKDVGEIAREEGEEEEDCGRRSKGVYFLPANLRSERFRYERRRRILSLGKRIFFNEGGGGNSRSPRDSWATKKKKKTFHYHWNDVCVCGTHFAQPKFNSCVVFKNAALPGAAASTLPGERGARNSWRRS